MQRYNCAKQKKWSHEVRERDGHKCKNCGTSENLEAHHLIPWKMNEQLRYEISNGMTVCGSCHAKLEGRGYHNRGKKFTAEHRKKLSEAKIGYTPWNKDKRAPLPKEKICKDCNIMKTIEEFTPTEGGKWRTNRCKSCRNKMLTEKRNS
jgi:hypothetical protein